MPSLFTTAYDRVRFGRRIDYRQPLPTAVAKQDQGWLQTILAKAPQR